ncbi:MAG TPA: diaminopropionate ammonia-lyase [Thermodesulfobacteriota bacterium]|nr:diaminopropionate ammonia-lyase [Thermodesulfobacteriota bacterium]
MNSKLYFNPRVMRQLPVLGPSRDPIDFHRRLPGYAPTRIVSAPDLARKLGVGRVWVKDESSRYGLPSFKILGAWWAAYRLLVEIFGQELESWASLEELRGKLEPMRPLDLVAATDGNHGRAVARIAALLGFGARIFVPENTTAARIEAIASEGARVAVVKGAYEDALQRAVEEQNPRALLVQDITLPGYEDVPRWAMEGYSTIFWETDEILAARGEGELDLVVAQVGGGAFAAAAVRHYRRSPDRSPRIVTAETACAASTLASMRAGRVLTVPGPHDSMMSGLNCGTVSTVAWPFLRDGVDCFAAIGDERVGEAMRFLAAAGLTAGETGASGAACLLELLDGPSGETVREKLEIGPSSRVLLVSTEGATDPEAFRRIVEGKEG